MSEKLLFERLDVAIDEKGQLHARPANQEVTVEEFQTVVQGPINTFPYNFMRVQEPGQSAQLFAQILKAGLQIQIIDRDIDMDPRVTSYYDPAEATICLLKDTASNRDLTAHVCSLIEFGIPALDEDRIAIYLTNVATGAKDFATINGDNEVVPMASIQSRRQNKAELMAERNARSAKLLKEMEAEDNVVNQTPAGQVGSTKPTLDI